MALTTKLRQAVLAAYHAPGVTLSRCAAGFYDNSRAAHPADAAVVVTIRTANTAVEMGLAVYNDPDVPSSLTLTPAGIAQAAAEIPAAA